MSIKSNDYAKVKSENLKESPLEKGEVLEEIAPQKIGIFSVYWVESKSISPSHSEKIFNSFHAGTIIHDQHEIERLMGIHAPLKVYVEYGSNRSTKN